MTAKRTPTKSRSESWQGSKWIRRDKRLAIYLRDGLACAYCGHSLEGGAKLTLDHIKPYIKGGSNKETNLITACDRCNSSRQDRPVAAFARTVAAYLNLDPKTADTIVQHVRRSSRRSIPRQEAKDLIARRGSYSAVITNGGR